MITIDGSYLEGGGQILRTALALSILTQQPFHIHHLRAKRTNPGLQPQHLACVISAKTLSSAIVDGAELHSHNLTFQPKTITQRKLDIDIGTAGSITLLLQSLLIPCIFSAKPATLTLRGGTDVPWSMPLAYFQEVFIPHIKKYCKTIDVNVRKRGYYPAGGGEVQVKIRPLPSASLVNHTVPPSFVQLPPINLVKQGTLLFIHGLSHASSTLSTAQVAERQAESALAVLQKKFACPIDVRIEYSLTISSGSSIVLWAIFSQNPDDRDFQQPIILGADALGQKSIPAETVGTHAANTLIARIDTHAPVDRHLADNLIPWMALFPPSTVHATEITLHTRTAIYAAQQFLPARFILTDDKNSITSH